LDGHHYLFNSLLGASISQMNEWIALRNLLDSLEHETSYHKLDSVAQRVLEWVYIRSQSNEPLFVQEIIVRSGIASPATLHKSIACLRDEGFLELSIDTHDARRRRVQITDLCHQVMSELSTGIISWADSLAPRKKRPVGKA
jgi:DNA-binding MarR family transcriptional regulator